MFFAFCFWDTGDKLPCRSRNILTKHYFIFEEELQEKHCSCCCGGEGTAHLVGVVWALQSLLHLAGGSTSCRQHSRLAPAFLHRAEAALFLCDTDTQTLQCSTINNHQSNKTDVHKESKKLLLNFDHFYLWYVASHVTTWKFLLPEQNFQVVTCVTFRKTHIHLNYLTLLPLMLIESWVKHLQIHLSKQEGEQLAAYLHMGCLFCSGMRLQWRFSAAHCWPSAQQLCKSSAANKPSPAAGEGTCIK